MGHLLHSIQRLCWVGYLFDWGLPRNCPELLDGFVMPSYMSTNFMKLFPLELNVPGRNWPR